MKKVAIVSFLLVSIGSFAGGYLYGQHRTSLAMMDNYLVGDKYRIIRTSGGMLEVSTMKKQETFARKTSWECPGKLCESLPASITSVSGVASYTYRIPLADHWVLEKKSPLSYLLQVPRLEVKTPVAIDLASIQISNAGSLLSPSGPSQSAMQTYMQPLVNERGQSSEYVALQKAAATKTVQEFAIKWLRDGDTRLPEGATIEVVFSN